ncbi:MULTISPECIES: hypothetical protein [Burkholderia]|uniref:Acyl-protein synthetase LuxE domain-containing protein n=1 Tax=Burkholderia orbicola (strain MC0-3) TaxID=406425 RepID=B1KCR9_BURO0|nr:MULTISPECIES: hypothetical protein [Burkholderia]ACA96016.1 conserved hypothetical protein [Burkholderia orbicola MC0-3]KWU23706.1 hypothetical protein AS149_35845 [Burkholderia cenocepacia]MBY4798508.1 hypothetical protein [Burkholderia cepacia]RQV54332.1 hypothetical protein DF024_33050 [Burkholderia cenocepacia]CAG2362437.1 hypothetical protein BCCR75389_06136 [Burkholderia cenocepacia]
MSALDPFYAMLRGDADPFRAHPRDLRDLQLAAMKERFAERSTQIRLLRRRADDMGVETINRHADMIPLLFAHQIYKSYPEQFIDNGRWKHLATWLQTLSSNPVSDIDMTGVEDVDAWMGKLRDAGHYVFSSSGTSGKCSFINQTRTDLDSVTESCVKLGIHGNALLHRDFGKRPVFLMMPPAGAHRHIEPVLRAAKRLGAESTLMFDEPVLASATIAMGRMRRAIADGSAKPSEVAALQEHAAARQRHTGAMIDGFLDKLAARRDIPVLVQGNWSLHWTLAERARQRGIDDGICHPDTVITTGGGLKGTSAPADYREQIMRFYGIRPENIQNSYGMSEMIGAGPWSEVAQGYAICPWIVPFVLDKTGEQLLNPSDGRGVVEGRFAFFDLLADGYWGGFITGDKVTVDFSPSGTTDGLQGPLIKQVGRYADLEEGEDKLSCAGTMESYVRGMISV